MNTDLQKVETALVGMDKVRAGLADLAQRYKGIIYQVATPEGMREATLARRACREPRLEVERIRKEAKAPLLELGRSLDRTAQAITAEIEALEAPIDRQIKAEEARVEAEKQARIRAELDRVEGIRQRLAYIQLAPVRAAGKPLDLIEAVQRDLAQAWAPGTYDEFEAQAQQLHAESSSALETLHAERAQFDVEVLRLAELKSKEEARLHEERERERIEREERERAEAQERQRKRAEEEQERARKDAEMAAEREAIREEREEIARQKADADERDRKAREEKERKARLQETKRQERLLRERRDKREEVVSVVATHYEITPAAAESLLIQLFEGVTC